MKETFPNMRCIVDCTEFKVLVPSSLTLHKMLYPDYKNHITVKVLVGIVPRDGFSLFHLYVLVAFLIKASKLKVAYQTQICGSWEMNLWQTVDSLLRNI